MCNRPDEAGTFRWVNLSQSMLNLILMLLLANLANTRWCKEPETWAHGYSSESFPMNTNMTGFRCFLRIFESLCFGWKVASALIGLMIWQTCTKYHKASCYYRFLINISPLHIFQEILWLDGSSHNSLALRWCRQVRVNQSAYYNSQPANAENT